MFKEMSHDVNARMEARGGFYRCRYDDQTVSGPLGTDSFSILWEKGCTHLSLKLRGEKKKAL
jgi:hypothetical protein